MNEFKGMEKGKAELKDFSDVRENKKSPLYEALKRKRRKTYQTLVDDRKIY